ncbi:MAG: TPR Domain containing protein [Candidatus Yanofskybacteria bacterium GW2011_GWD2_39_48]|uniref:TPR Domain containing protein n=1 Tax=Candidatus Yanofskybacteria bacterium GW2011_GWD2_39_48 TaxID=1619031 RepID=A0A0G0P734_9BACT|nr:MAG: TPR Domain containing protein [Candidatus Yanofskybacteria bacterium GW2011_GWD2_39_48]
MSFLSKIFGTDPESEKRDKFQEIEREFINKPFDLMVLTKAQWLVNRGDDFRRRNQFDQAIKDYKEALIFNPKHISAYMSWGAVLRKKGMLKDAIDILEKAPKESSGFNDYYVHELLFGLGGMYMEMGDNGKAIDYFEKSLKVYNDIQFNSTIMELQKIHKKSAKGHEQEWEEREINIEAVELAKELLKQLK